MNGLDLNNPGNLEVGGPRFIGQIDPPAGKFLRFIADTYGLRAIIERLKAYRDNDGCKTIRTMISRYAPPGDHNPTSAYITNVSAVVGIGPDDIVDLDDPMTQGALMRAITKQEQGVQPYPDLTINKAVAMV